MNIFRPIFSDNMTKLSAVYYICLRANITSEGVIYRDLKYLHEPDDVLDMTMDESKTDVRFSELELRYVSLTCILAMIPIMAIEIKAKPVGGWTLTRYQVSRLS
jgi:hypothetical protein